MCQGCWRGQTVAVKRQRMALRPGAESAEVDKGAKPTCDYAGLMQEILISAQLPVHPNICRFHGACVDSQDRSVLNLVYEYVEGRDIECLYADASGHERDWRPSLDQALALSIQLADGLACLHGCRPTAFVHRDIKPSNLLVSADQQVLKICDFGLCTVREYDAQGNMLAPSRAMTGGTGSYRYMAPEVFTACGAYNASVDVFSAACCIFFLMTGKPVMSEIEDAREVATAVVDHCRQPLDMLFEMEQPALADTISAAWDPEPARRPPAAALAGLLRQHRAAAKAVSSTSAKSAGRKLVHSMTAVRDRVIGYVTRRRGKSIGSPPSPGGDGTNIRSLSASPEPDSPGSCFQPSLREAGRQLSEPLPQARPGRALSGNDRQLHAPAQRSPVEGGNASPNVLRECSPLERKLALAQGDCGQDASTNGIETQLRLVGFGVIGSAPKMDPRTGEGRRTKLEDRGGEPNTDSCSSAGPSRGGKAWSLRAGIAAPAEGESCGPQEADRRGGACAAEG